MTIAPESPVAASSTAERILARGRVRRAYRVRLATNAADLRAAQELRFRVFNLELSEGLAQSYATGLDADAFDDICDHLLVEDPQTDEVVGTYRLQTGATAASSQGLGYYSAQEFELAPLEPLRGEIIELGRACVAKPYRNLIVLGLLWQGIAAYARERRARYLIGCSSLTSQDAAVGATLFANLQRHHLAPPEWRVRPHARVACPLDRLLEETPKTPRLLDAYLSLGAKICGPPAIDREFHTIDFLTLLDLEALSANLRRQQSA